MSAPSSTFNGQSHSSGARESRHPAFDDDSLVIDFFDRLGTALSTGDASPVAAAWQAPALVIGHEGVVHALSSRDEVEALFAGAR